MVDWKYVGKLGLGLGGMAFGLSGITLSLYLLESKDTVVPLIFGGLGTFVSAGFTGAVIGNRLADRKEEKALEEMAKYNPEGLDTQE